MEYDEQVRRMKACECPACTSHYTIYVKSEKYYWCRKCGYEWIVTQEGEVKEHK